MTGGSGPAITRLRGQELARRELARSIYHPSLLAQWWHDIERWLSSLVNGQHAGSPGVLGLVLLAVALLAVVAAVMYWLGPTRVNRQIRDRAVLAAKPRSAAEHRATAERMASAGEYQAAIIERLRAIAVDLEEREILLPIPARTAMELAAEAGAAFPAEAASLAAAARLFDDVRYGGRAGTERGYDRIRALDIRLKAAQAAPAAPARSGAVRPGLPGLPAAGTLVSAADKASGQLP
jgi:Domain of unknown function (DUF4129)